MKISTSVQVSYNYYLILLFQYSWLDNNSGGNQNDATCSSTIAPPLAGRKREAPLSVVQVEHHNQSGAEAGSLQPSAKRRAVSTTLQSGKLYLHYYWYLLSADDSHLSLLEIPIGSFAMVTTSTEKSAAQTQIDLHSYDFETHEHGHILVMQSSDKYEKGCLFEVNLAEPFARRKGDANAIAVVGYIEADVNRPVKAKIEIFMLKAKLDVDALSSLED